ncbi:MAG: DDE-type integrase/transposase/recombinase [Anaerolineales bacterium]
MKEKNAAARTLAIYQPRKEWHFPLSLSSIRKWHRQVGQQNSWQVLFPKSTRPKTIHYQVPDVVVGIIFTLRTLFGWGGHRIAAELKERGIATVCGQTVYHIFARLGLSVKTYALKGRSDGIAYQRYEKKRPNQQWHIDLKHAKLSDGSPVSICILIDDYSRYALAAVAGTSATTEGVTRVTQAALKRAGKPDELVSDNGREFVSVWEDSLTQFGKLLADNQIEHRTTAPYYPQGNGKAEAFIKTISQELLDKHTFETLEDLQNALDKYLTYYNNYRLHSALAWKTPASRYTGQRVNMQGLAGIPGIEPMAANPAWGPSSCDPPNPNYPPDCSKGVRPYPCFIPCFCLKIPFTLSVDSTGCAPNKQTRNSSPFFETR